MISVVLIDDEKDARFLLRKQLEANYPKSLKILGEANDVNSGLALIQNEKPDLVFLDINMPDGTGFDLLSELNDYSFEVIFVTAYDDFALKAFEYSAFGYLTKPIHTDKLKSTIEKYLEIGASTEKDKITVLMDNFSNDHSLKKLVIPNNKGFEVCQIADIVRIEGDRNYSNIFLSSGAKYTSSKTLGQYDSLLTEMGFFRIHQSTLINMRCVTSFKKIGGGTVELNDGSSHKVSRYRKEEFLKQFLN